MDPDDTNFEPAIMRSAVKGAWIGVLSVLAAFVAAIVLTDAGMDLMGVAGLSAAFGGSGFGAMLGASTAAAREPIPIRASASIDLVVVSAPEEP